MRIVTCFFVSWLCLFTGAISGQQRNTIKGQYIAGDFHQHTTYSGGEYSIGFVMEASNRYKLDWWANNDHGGTREYWGKISGKDLGKFVTWDKAGVEILGDKGQVGFMWRWQSLRDYNFIDVLEARQKYSDKLILQAFEWNVPGHEHANVCIIAGQFDNTNPNCSPLAQFEYMFDKSDKDISGGKAQGWNKSVKKDKEKALEAIAWLQSNYQKQSYVFIGHPERSSDYTIADLRMMNNAGPDVCFGFEAMPGHQKSSSRGGYKPDESYGTAEYGGKKGATFGGAGIFAAKIGGVWDALLSEGRNMWIASNSDFHKGEFFPGEYQKNYVYVKDRNNPQDLMDGLRSGNIFIVTGDLIKSLNYTIEGASMGETLKTTKRTVVVKIEVYDPDTSNFNTYSSYKNPVLDHIDLIEGKVTGLISPGSPGFAAENVSTTRVIARFDKTGGTKDNKGIKSIKWTDLGNGWKRVLYECKVDGNSYLRLRGTNHSLNTPGETDGEGNPLPDISGENSASKAFEDLWFYSNPIFISGQPK